MSLAPVGEALAGVLGHPVHFAADCIGPEAEAAVSALKDGEVLVLENTRYHPGEEANDPEMARALASLADIYVKRRVLGGAPGTCQHRGGWRATCPAHAGRLMQAELTRRSPSPWSIRSDRSAPSSAGAQGLHQARPDRQHPRPRRTC